MGGGATAHCRPRPPPTATPLLCRRYVLVPLGRPLKRDSVAFRWNALGAHDSTEEELRLREAERETRKRRSGRRRKDHFLHKGYFLETEEKKKSLWLEWNEINRFVGTKVRPTETNHLGWRRSHFLTSQIPPVPPGGASNLPTGAC